MDENTNSKIVAALLKESIEIQDSADYSEWGDSPDFDPYSEWGDWSDEGSHTETTYKLYI